MSTERKCLIVGGGFSGLSLAYWAVKKGLQVVLVEEKISVGGLLASRRVQGHLVESAANAFLWSDDFLELERDLGVKFIATKPESRRRYIYRGRRFRRWPLGIIESLGFIWNLFRNWNERAPRALETISEWGERVLGRSARVYLLETALQGIYAGDPSRMSARLILGRFFGVSRSTHSSASSRRGSFTHPEGMGALAQALRLFLEKSKMFEMRPGERFGPDDLIAARAAGRHVFIATPPHEAAEILRPDYPALAEALASIEMLPVATATTIWDRGEGERGMPRGFGVLFPRGEAIEALGLLRNHHIFESRSDRVSETWIYSGRGLKSRGLWDNDSGLRGLVESERFQMTGLHLAPELFECYFWERGIPHYTVDLEETLQKCALADFGRREGIDVLGNYTGHLGLARIFGEARRLIEERSKIDV